MASSGSDLRVLSFVAHAALTDAKRETFCDSLLRNDGSTMEYTLKRITWRPGHATEPETLSIVTQSSN